MVVCRSGWMLIPSIVLYPRRAGVVAGAAILAARRLTSLPFSVIRCISADRAAARRRNAEGRRDPPLAEVGRSSALHHM